MAGLLHGAVLASGVLEVSGRLLMPARLTPPRLKIVENSRRWLPLRSDQVTTNCAFTSVSAVRSAVVPELVALVPLRVTVKLPAAGAGLTPGRA